MTTKQILEQRKALQEDFKKFQEKENKLRQKAKDFNLDRNDENSVKLYLQISKEHSELLEEKEHKRKVNLILKNNFATLFLKENKEKIKEVFCKFQNKKIGEKTKQNLIKEAADQGINIVTFNGKNLRIRTELGDFDYFTIENITNFENKINMEAFNEINKWDNFYIEDPENYLEEKRKNFNLIKNKIFEIEKLVKEYNENVIDGIIKEISFTCRNHYFD